MKSQRLLLGWLLALCALAIGSAAQAQATFESTPHTSFDNAPVVSGPLTFTTAGFHAVGDSGSLSPISPIAGDGNFLVYNSTVGFGDSFSMSALAPFNLLALDLAGWYNFGPSAQAVTVTGIRADNSTVSANLSVLPGSFTHFALLGFSNLTAVNLVHGGSSASYYVGVDNIVTTPVPEPATFAMMLGGLVLLAYAARRRQQSH